MKTHKPLANISLDLDNQWSYMKTHGDKGWETFPTYLDIFIPHVLDLLDKLDLKITFFIVGQDAVIEKNKPYLRMITARGHEVGNHTFKHETWLQTYSKEQIETEIELAENVIFSATGGKTTGFRGPGFTWSRNLLEVLHKKGYLYDASTLPMYIGPIARQFFFWTSKLSKEERNQRKELFGPFKEGFRPVKPYKWKLPNNETIIEIPVTTMPIFKLPFHLSYLLYLSGFSIVLMKLYLNLAILMCKLTKTSPSFLLHPLDLIGGDQLTELAFFPGMNISSDKKVKVFIIVINTLKKHFNLLDMGTYAKLISSNNLNQKVIK